MYYSLHYTALCVLINVKHSSMQQLGLCPCNPHLSSATEAGHSVTLAQVVEARLGELSGSYNGECPGVEGVQAVLLSAHARVVACWSLVGHVLYATRAEWAGGRWSGKAHI